MMPFSPISLLLTWFFSQKAVLYFVFVPLSAFAIFVGLMQLMSDRR